MIRDITLGQYFPADSILHRIDPRIKILWTVFYIVLLFFVHNIWGYLLFGLVTFSFISISKVPVSYVYRGLKPLAILMVFTAVINLFMTTGGSAVCHIFKLTIYSKGIETAVLMILRLFFLVSGTSLLTFTTSPIMLTDGMERLMNPLKKIKVPAHEIAMMMSIAIRFIPTLLEETDKIIKAQTARGADLENSNPIKKAKAMIPILVPLFISAFRRADELAVAMEARCYHGGEHRTRMKQLKISHRDYAAVLFGLLFLGAIILLNHFSIDWGSLIA